MKERDVAVQFKDPTGETAVRMACARSGGRRRFRVIHNLPTEEIISTIAAPAVEVDPVNGVKIGHQTGITTMHSIELKLAEIRQHYIKGDVPHAELKMRKAFYLGELRDFQSASRR